MKFPVVNQDPCPESLPGNGGADGDVQSLVIKPGLVTGCVGSGFTVDTSVINVVGAGLAAVNGAYAKINDSQYNQAGGSYTIILSGPLWYLYDEFAVAKYTCPVADFPTGPWTASDEGDAPEPDVAYASNQQFRTFLRSDNAGEVEVTSGLLYQSSNPAVVAIDATTGVATLLSAGIATVTVVYGNLSASAQVEVVGEGNDCCSETTISTVVALDDSKSMSLVLNSGTRLSVGKVLINALFDAMRWDKDRAGLFRFDTDLTEVQAIGSIQPVAAVVNAIAQTTRQTNIETVLDAAIAALASETADRKVIVLLSDGENRPNIDGVIPSPASILTKGEAFKNGGGIIVCVGLAAAGDGFALLQALASGGFFLNAYDVATTGTAQTALVGFLCYYCAGLPPSYGMCLTEPVGEQVPAPAALPDTELTSVQSYTATKEACVACSGSGESVSQVPEMTSNTAPSGTAFASSELVDHEAFRVFDGGALVAGELSYWTPGPSITTGHVGYHFTAPKVITIMAITAIEPAVGAPKNFTIEGSSDGTNWTVLLTAQNVSWSDGERKQFPFYNNTAYAYYRLKVTATFPGISTQNLNIRAIEMFGTDAAMTCATRSAVSYVSQADADSKAYTAALAAATAACGSSTNGQTIQFNNGTLAPATPYPSVKQVTGGPTSITKVVVTLNSVKRSEGAPAMLLLRSPSGTTCMLWYVTTDAVSRPFNGVQIVLDSTAGSFIPFDTGSGPIPAGTFKPTVLDSGENVAMPLPAPQGVPYSKLLSVFNGENANGQWQLFAAHKNFFSIYSPGNYQLIGGWDLTIT